MGEDKMNEIVVLGGLAMLVWQHDPDMFVAAMPEDEKPSIVIAPEFMKSRYRVTVERIPENKEPF